MQGLVCRVHRKPMLPVLFPSPASYLPLLRLSYSPPCGLMVQAMQTLICRSPAQTRYISLHKLLTLMCFIGFALSRTGCTASLSPSAPAWPPSVGVFSFVCIRLLWVFFQRWLPLRVTASKLA